MHVVMRFHRAGVAGAEGPAAAMPPCHTLQPPEPASRTPPFAPCAPSRPKVRRWLCGVAGCCRRCRCRRRQPRNPLAPPKAGWRAGFAQPRLLLVHRQHPGYRLCSKAAAGSQPAQHSARCRRRRRRQASLPIHWSPCRRPAAEDVPADQRGPGQAGPHDHKRSSRRRRRCSGAHRAAAAVDRGRRRG